MTPEVSSSGALRVGNMDSLIFAENASFLSFSVSVSPPVRLNEVRDRGYGTESFWLKCDDYCETKAGNASGDGAGAQVKVHMVYSAVGTPLEDNPKAGRVVHKRMRYYGELNIDKFRLALIQTLWQRLRTNPILQATLRHSAYVDAVSVTTVQTKSTTNNSAANLTVSVAISAYNDLAANAAERLKGILDGDGLEDSHIRSVAWDILERLDGNRSFAEDGANTSNTTNSIISNNGTDGSHQNSQAYPDPQLYIQRETPAIVEFSRPHTGLAAPAPSPVSISPSKAPEAEDSEIVIKLSVLTDITSKELESDQVRMSFRKSIARSLALDDESFVNITALYRCDDVQQQNRNPLCIMRRKLNEEAGRSYRELSGEVGMVYIIFSILAPEHIVAAVEDKVIFSREIFVTDLSQATSEHLSEALQREVTIKVHDLAVIKRVREGELQEILSPSASSNDENPVDYVMRLLYMGLGALLAVVVFATLLAICRCMRKRQKIIDEPALGLKSVDSTASTYILAPYTVNRYQLRSIVEVSVQKGPKFEPVETVHTISQNQIKVDTSTGSENISLSSAEQTGFREEDSRGAEDVAEVAADGESPAGTKAEGGESLPANSLELQHAAMDEEAVIYRL